MEVKLPTANTMLHHHRFLFKACWRNHCSSIVSNSGCIQAYIIVLTFVSVFLFLCCFYVSMDTRGLTQIK